MPACLLLVQGHAYGVAVVSVMGITTLLFCLFMVVCWELRPVVVAPFAVFFLCIEMLFLSSNL
jgi:KUP system potassium uptake protein